MSDLAKTVRPDLVPAGGQDLDGLLGRLVAYLDALEARVGALERRLSAVPLMTAADAARYARVNVEAILRAVRVGETRGSRRFARSPGSLAMPSTAGLPRDHPRRHPPLRNPAAVAGERQARRSRRRGGRWAECRAAGGHGAWLTLETYGQVMDGLGDAAMSSCRLAAARLRSERSQVQILPGALRVPPAITALSADPTSQPSRARRRPDLFRFV